MTDTGRPDANGLMGNFDCMTLYTMRAAQAAGLEHETLCAIMSEAQGLADDGRPGYQIVGILRVRCPDVFFSLSAMTRGDGWQILAWGGGPQQLRVPVAFSPSGWAR